MKLRGKCAFWVFVMMGFCAASPLYACGSGCGCMGSLPPEVKAQVDAGKVMHGCPSGCMCDVAKSRPETNAVRDTI